MVVKVGNSWGNLLRFYVLTALTSGLLPLPRGSTLTKVKNKYQLEVIMTQTNKQKVNNNKNIPQ